MIADSRLVHTILSLAVALMVVASGMALADDQSISDADDAAGRFDIESAVATHHQEERGFYRTLRHNISTYDNWGPEDTDRASNRLAIAFDLDRDGRTDRALFIQSSDDGSLYGQMVASSEPSFRGYARAWREDERSVSVTFPKRLLRKKVKVYRWRVYSVYSNPDDEQCPGDPEPPDDVSRYCYDFAPGDGEWVTHRI